ncbi:pre-mRNA-splicing factor ATP-dependent RNA helicase DEAH1 isoform X1 [Medicago truncatula]|uniref:pre-mRNA-splicing factor ATP-dependent RNA helicase DEAH1 isoform X1 n=1 Tax=Medicago truncatula TaxID=3880 RepID=UPI000D2F381B|nr:pre-mRNA-splicing factor ATP-dependent RNA helicase DEAH1 isoform X1 [Medicago truncatula]XP_039687812.1 pre-mRNA-splicing factor ATP-dependent RNA helicase DEAH1 isoform X1 [Medicago truncatula]
MLARKQGTYTILKDDDCIDDDHIVSGDDKSSITTASTSRKPDSHKKRFRKKTEVQDDQEDEVSSRKERERQVKRRITVNEDSGSESEEERLKDQREKDELVQHMRERDAAATRKLTEQKLARMEEDEAIRRSNAAEHDDMRCLRKYSRQEYLKKREEKKLEELRDDIEDEQYLFEGVKLSEVEQRELKHKKELYELIKKRSEHADNVNEYRMPDAYDQEGDVDQEKRFSVAMQRYRDSNAEEKMNPFSEQEAWEEHQIGKATMKYGSKNKKQASDDYQFVFEDQIDFIKASVMDGDKFDYHEMADSIEKSKAKSASEALAIQWHSTIMSIAHPGALKAPASAGSGKGSHHFGFFPHTAKLQKNGSYWTLKHVQTVDIHPSSGLAQVRPRCVVYHELVLTTKEYMRQITELKSQWLLQPNDLEDTISKKMPHGEGRAENHRKYIR